MAAVKVQSKNPEKRLFILEVEGFIPMKLQFETWAENEEEALENLDHKKHLVRIRKAPEFSLSKLKSRKTVVIEFLSSIVKKIRNF